MQLISLRLTATPSPATTPGGSAAPAYASSLRSTHVAGDDAEEEGDEDRASGPATAPVASLPIPVIAPLSNSTTSGTASFVASPADMSSMDFNFPDALSFNPSLNQPGAAFDPFGVGGDGTPSLFPPDGIFDWESWSSFFQGEPMSSYTRGRC